IRSSRYRRPCALLQRLNRVRQLAPVGCPVVHSEKRIRIELAQVERGHSVADQRLRSLGGGRALFGFGQPRQRQQMPVIVQSGCDAQELQRRQKLPVRIRIGPCVVVFAAIQGGHRNLPQDHVLARQQYRRHHVIQAQFLQEPRISLSPLRGRLL